MSNVVEYKGYRIEPQPSLRPGNDGYFANGKITDINSSPGGFNYVHNSAMLVCQNEASAIEYFIRFAKLKIDRNVSP